MHQENPLFPLTDEEISQILKIIDESNFDELHLETAGLKLTVARHGATLTPPEPRLKIPSPQRPRESQIQAPSTAEPEKPKADTAGIAAPEQDGLVSIKAPTLGIFYRSPKPGAPPFVDVGSAVLETDTVCLLEVMKLFNAVKAGVRGRVVKICAENTQMVEYNQTLFLIEPEEFLESSRQ